MMKKNSVKWVQWICLGSLFFLAGFVRYHDLTTQFAHYDDVGVGNTIIKAKKQDLSGLYAKKQQLYDPTFVRHNEFAYRVARGLNAVGLLDAWIGMIPSFAVPQLWTYAPAQFILTTPLIKTTYRYREILYWGRLPSFIFGMLTLVAMFFLIGELYPSQKFPAAVLGLTLLAFSWQHIIYSKHMSNYALAALATVLLVLVLLRLVRGAELSFSSLLGAGFFLGLLVWCHYQVLLFLPAFFLVLACFYLRKPWKPYARHLLPLGKLAAGALACLSLVVPVFILFLNRVKTWGINHWNRGPKEEYIFPSFGEGGFFTWVGHALHCVAISVKGLIQVNLLFVPDDSAAFVPASVILIGLVLAGVYRFARTKERNKQAFGLFVAFTALVWSFLIVRQSIVLSPTRHTLILLPLLLILVIEGVLFCAEKIPSPKPQTLFSRLAYGLSLLIVFLFFGSFSTVNQRRADPFDPATLLKRLKEYDVKTMVLYEYTQNVWAMANDLAGVEIIYLEHGMLGFDYYFPDSRKRPFAIISHRMRIPKQQRDRFNIIYSEERDSDVEGEFLNWTKNGANSFYFYVLNAPPAGTHKQ